LLQPIDKNLPKPIAIVRGVGDVGSAIIWELHHAGFNVVAHENRQSRTIRRHMAFSDALWDGTAVLQGLTIFHKNSIDDVEAMLDAGDEVALYSGPLTCLTNALKPQLIVDGRIQKFSTIETIINQASLTLGVGPGFIAQEHVDFVIESCWGNELGNIIKNGSARDPVPVPPKLNGVGWQRFIRSDKNGEFNSHKKIGQYVDENQPIGMLDEQHILAPISGHIRGLLRSGFCVGAGEKLCEIDPRAEFAHFEGLAERPHAIAKGVVRAVNKYLKK